MICPPCRQASTLNTPGFWNLALALHALCEAPHTCPCQHKTGKYINTEAMKK